MKKERFGVETEPYKLYRKNEYTIYVGDRFNPVPKISFCYVPFLNCVIFPEQSLA